MSLLDDLLTSAVKNSYEKQRQKEPSGGSIGATPRNSLGGLLADKLLGLNDYAQRSDPSMPMGKANPVLSLLADAVGLPGTANTVNELSYGNYGALGTGSGMTWKPKSDTVDAVTTLMPLGASVGKAALDGGVKLAQKAAPAIERMVPQVMEKGGLPAQLLGDLAYGTQSHVYLPHTAKKPNALVGTRYETEFVGNMAPKTPRRIEDLQGSSLLAMPWDSTSRGYNIKSISDEVLPHAVLTTGGQDFARDLAHITQNVGGASNAGIAKRIQDRVRMAAKENMHFGGNGEVYSLPTTMGEGGENFSTMPTEALLGLIQKQDLAPSQLNQINEWVRNSTIPKSGKTIRPFTNFAGVDTDQGLLQFITGEGIDTTAGELRKAFANEMGLVRGQKMLGYNKEDLVNALTDPSLRGVGKGYAGNTIIKSDPYGSLTPSDHPSYDTNFPGVYHGSLLQNIPIEHLMPKTYRSLAEEMASRGGDLRNNVIGAMEKRKSGISEIVDQQVIDSVNNYLRSQGLN